MMHLQVEVAWRGDQCIMIHAPSLPNYSSTPHVRDVPHSPICNYIGMSKSNFSFIILFQLHGGLNKEIFVPSIVQLKCIESQQKPPIKYEPLTQKEDNKPTSAPFGYYVEGPSLMLYGEYAEYALGYIRMYQVGFYFCFVFLKKSFMKKLFYVIFL